MCLLTSRIAAAAAVLPLLVAACANPREDARGELHLLRTAVERHAAKFGHYPRTLDPRLPESAENLPHRAGKGVTLRLVHAGADGMQALARRRSWICSLNVDAQRRERIECTPLSSSTAEQPLEPSGAAPSVVESRDSAAPVSSPVSPSPTPD